MALASIIRGIESGTPMPAKFTLSLTYVFLSSIMITFYRCKLGAWFQYPWHSQILNNQHQNGDLVSKEFRYDQLFAILTGGISEFIASISVIMSFNAA